MLKESKVITIYCDEVLCDTVGYMLKYTDFFWVLKYENVDLAQLTRMYHYIHEHLDELLRNDVNIIQHMEPIATAQKSLQQLVEQWYTLYVITGRTDNMCDFTYQWLEYYFPDMIKEVFFCNNYKSKAIAKVEVCLKVWSGLMIDDDPRFVDDIEHIPVFLVDRPWNKNYAWTHAQRVKTWEEMFKNLL